MKNNTRIANTKPNFRNHLVTQSPNHLITFPKAAFTLAEVLITLAIIGVVAAITIPSLVQKYKERETVTRVKEFYSAFSQAYQLAILEHGTFDQWGLGDSIGVENEDGSTSLNETTINNLNKFFDIMKKYLKFDSYTAFNSTNVGTDADGHTREAFIKRGLVLQNGTAIRSLYLQTSRCDSVNCGDFYIVTDGGLMSEEREDGQAYKRSQTFAFNIYKDHIEPYTPSQSTFEDACLRGNNYSRCTGWVIKNGNMDYLHCNDLSWTGKQKCNEGK